MNKKVTKYWCCGRCDEKHEHEDDAIECCQPEVYEIFICPICDEEHDFEKDALSCCGDMDGEAIVKDGRVFPAHIKTPQQYVEEYLQLNGFKI